jgi:SH3-like domain-containing protein
MNWQMTVLLTFSLCLVAVSAPAERLSVSAQVANIRSGPGTGYDILWKVERYYPLKITEKKGKWYRFEDYAGDSGWVHRTLLGGLNTVVTRKPVCNIRTGPGTKNDILMTVEDGVPFRILRKKGRWIHIEHADGDRGWIHDSLVW